MTKEDAEIVRTWRVDLGCTWRRVAELAADKWPELGLDGFQSDGIEICEKAR